MPSAIDDVIPEPPERGLTAVGHDVGSGPGDGTGDGVGALGLGPGPGLGVGALVGVAVGVPEGAGSDAISPPHATKVSGAASARIDCETPVKKRSERPERMGTSVKTAPDLGAPHGFRRRK